MTQVITYRSDTKGAMTTPESIPLHVFLGDYGQVLSTRDRGREAAERMRSIADTPGDLILDFDGVEVASPPYLQEVAGTAQNLVVRNRDTGRIVLYAQMAEDVAETMAFVAARMKIVLAYVEGNRVDLLGATPQDEETLRAAQTLQSFTAPRLAELMEIKPDTATHRLKKLLETGAVVRELDPGVKQGVRHIYRAGHPELLQADGRRTQRRTNRSRT